MKKGHFGFNEKYSGFLIRNVICPKKLEPNERGALIFPPFDFGGDDNSLTVNGKAFDEDTLRGHLLLFDKLDCPDNNLFGFGDGAPPGLEKWEGFQQTQVVCGGGKFSNTALRVMY